MKLVVTGQFVFIHSIAYLDIFNMIVTETYGASPAVFGAHFFLFGALEIPGNRVGGHFESVEY